MKIPKIAFTLVAFFCVALNSFAQANTAPADPPAPEAIDRFRLYLAPKNQLSICPVKGGDCQNITMPESIGQVIRVQEGPKIKTAKISWVAFSLTGATLCAVALEDASSDLACTTLPKLTAAIKKQSLQSSSPINVGALSALFKAIPSETKTAGSNIQRGLALIASGGAKSNEIICDDECDGGSGGGGGDAGGGVDGGFGGGGASTDLPPGAAPGDSPTQISCFVQAYTSWEIMDNFCNSQSNATDRAVCKQTNTNLYAQEQVYCRSL